MDLKQMNCTFSDSVSLNWTRSEQSSYDEQDISILFSRAHLFAVSNKGELTIHSLVSSNDKDSRVPANTITAKFDLHENIKCSAATPLHDVFVCSNDNEILLFHWDSLLGEWGKIIVSQGESRVLKINVATKGKQIWVAAFKWDVIVVYLLTSVHTIDEQGPLLLENIHDVSCVEKGKCGFLHETSFMINQDNLFLLAFSTTNTLHMWEITSGNQYKSKLLKQQTLSIKGETIFSDVLENETGTGQFFLLMSSDGSGELFFVDSTGFTLLNKIKMCNENQDNNNSNQTGQEEGMEWRILGCKFCGLREGSKPVHNQGDGEWSDLLTATINTNKLFPHIITLILTTRGLSILDMKSGHTLHELDFSELSTSIGIDIDRTIQNASLSVTPNDEVFVAFQPLFSSAIHVVGFSVSTVIENPENPKESCCSFVISDAIDAKSVLRKRFKSPPPVVIPKRHSQSPRRKALKRITSSKYTKPSWITKTATKRSSSPIRNLMPPPAVPGYVPLSARLTNSNGHRSSCDQGIMTPRPIPFRRKGSYDDTNVTLASKICLGSGLIDSGQSYLRLATSSDGKILCAGGSVSPVALIRTSPSWEGVKLLKEYSKVTSLHFNFRSSLLVSWQTNLVGSNERRTRIIDWRKEKELVTWDFASKFNEHVHAQFYFMDKFVLQAQCNCVALYAINYDLPETDRLGKCQAASFPLKGQNIASMAAPNLFLSANIVAGLSNKSLQILDVNVEKVKMDIKNAHSKPVSCIRLNESPTHLNLVDLILTSCASSSDPIKLFDIRTGSCVLRISDVNPCVSFVPTARPAISPCGRLIATGMEDNSLVVYDTRKLRSRLHTFEGLRATVLDCTFDTSSPTLWGGTRQGTFWAFTP